MNSPPPMIRAASRYLTAILTVLYGLYDPRLSVANSQNISRIPQYTRVPVGSFKPTSSADMICKLMVSQMAKYASMNGRNSGRSSSGQRLGYSASSLEPQSKAPSRPADRRLFRRSSSPCAVSMSSRRPCGSSRAAGPGPARGRSWAWPQPKAQRIASPSHLMRFIQYMNILLSNLFYSQMT